MFYSYSGSTKKLALSRAGELGADIEEIKDKKRHSVPVTFFAGCFNSLRMKSTPIEPVKVRLKDYGKITVMAPVWAGHPAPAANGALDLIPTGTEVEVVMVSDSGTSAAKDKIEAKLREKGCTLVKYTNISSKK